MRLILVAQEMPTENDERNDERRCGGNSRSARRNACRQRSRCASRARKTADAVKRVKARHHASSRALFDSNGVNVHGNVHRSDCAAEHCEHQTGQV